MAKQRNKFEIQHRTVFVIRDRKTHNFVKNKATDMKLVPFNEARLFTQINNVTYFYTQLEKSEPDWKDKYDFEAIQIDLDFDMNKYVRVR